MFFFKPQSFNSFYRKHHYGCYFPPTEDLIFWDALAGLPSPCLCVALPSRSLAPKQLTSYNLLTRALFTKTIRDHFEA